MSGLRYIGSKAQLLGKIEQVLIRSLTGQEQVFCDLFAGTGVVARYFKPRFTILANDSLYFSHVLQKAVIENNRRPRFSRLKKNGILDPYAFLEDTPLPASSASDPENFITCEYSPAGPAHRMYFTVENARRIDFVRRTIEAWKNKGWITKGEYALLLAGLLEGVPSVSNITGTYGAYLKQWDKRAEKPLELVRLEPFDNGRKNRCYQRDANRLISRIEGDILYLDPPYNARQYLPNYHVLETIARYDRPQVYGVTGMRPYEGEKSAYCIKGEVEEAFDELIARARFTHVLLSYSTEGLMTAQTIQRIMEKRGIAASFQQYAFPYRKYKSKLESEAPPLREFLFYVRKQRGPGRSVFGGLHSAAAETPAAGAGKYLKSPLNYVGGKFKLLPQLLPLFPPDVDTLVDLFAGGCNVGINAAARRVVCNDLNNRVIGLFQAFQEMELPEILRRIDRNIECYALSKENEEGFLALREEYNRTKDPIDLYTLACYSFNYQFRFNNQMEYNNPFGRNRSQFSLAMRQHLERFVKRIKGRDISFISMDFAAFPLSGLSGQDLIYCDPPYLITTGTYNDGKRGFKDWKEEQEKALCAYLDRAHSLGIRFALSNVLEHKGLKNEILLDWAKKYRIIELHRNYSNASYNTKAGGSREVLVVNYTDNGRALI